jgi:hypothetical protein
VGGKDDQALGITRSVRFLGHSGSPRFRLALADIAFSEAEVSDTDAARASKESELGG